MGPQEDILSIPKQGPVIAIDGPAGTGKSSATHRLADLLGFVHVDTGALYRSVAFLLMERFGGQLPSETDCVETTRSSHLEFRRKPGMNPVNRVFANGRDITTLIRTPEVSMAASQVSAVPAVRAALLGMQRRMGCAGPSILEGRDIGTVIFPDADVKFFLTASLEERAKRRLDELEATGADAPSFEEVKEQIRTRDQGDSTRSVAPLRKAVDAIEIDTSDFSLDEVVREMEGHVRRKVVSLRVK